MPRTLNEAETRHRSPMSVGGIPDVESLVAPITGANPSGESLRYAGTYDAIQDARRADDALAQGDWQRPSKASDWRGVIEIAPEALATRSQELQTAARPLLAAGTGHGFAGRPNSRRPLR